MITRITRLGRQGCDLIEALGRAGLFLGQSLIGRPSGEGVYLWLRQMHFIGVLSLAIILVSGLFIGMVLALQGYTILVDFGAEDALGQMVSLSLLRELAPVVAALLFAGRAGSALTAEIGLMKATEQLSSMEMIGVDPLKRVVAPRLWAGFVSLPLLTVGFSVIGVWGGHLVGVEWLGVYEGSYWGNMQASVDFIDDIGNGMIKSLVFALVVTWIAVFQGYDLVPTSEGISRATTRTVVYSSLAVLGLDFVLTALMFGELGMKRSKMMEFGVGLFMLAGILGIVFLGLSVSGLTVNGGQQSYTLEANFANIGGLKPRARVTMAGVTVGRVEAVELDTEWYDARVTLALDSRLEGQLSRDTTASILTSGLLGEQYIGLSVGGDPETLADGDTISDTQSALVLEELIQQFVANMAQE